MFVCSRRQMRQTHVSANKSLIMSSRRVRTAEIKIVLKYSFIKLTVFWDVAHFRGTCCPHNQGDNWISSALTLVSVYRLQAIFILAVTTWNLTCFAFGIFNFNIKYYNFVSRSTDIGGIMSTSLYRFLQGEKQIEFSASKSHVWRRLMWIFSSTSLHKSGRNLWLQ